MTSTRSAMPSTSTVPRRSAGWRCLGRQFGQHACTSTFAPTSMPRVGSSTISTDGLVATLAEHDLLHGCARQRGDRVGATAVLHPERSPTRRPPARSASAHNAPGDTADSRGSAALRSIARSLGPARGGPPAPWRARGDGRARVARTQRVPSTVTLPASRPSTPNHRSGHFGPTGTDAKTRGGGEPHDLAPAAR